MRALLLQLTADLSADLGAALGRRRRPTGGQHGAGMPQGGEMEVKVVITKNLLLVLMPFAPSSFLLLVERPGAPVASLLLVAMPGAPSSFWFGSS